MTKKTVVVLPLESSSDEDEDDVEHESSSEAFTDSIEDDEIDEIQLTAQSLSDSQVI